MDHIHLGTPQDKVRHQKMEEMISGTPEKAL
jgi:hypothetical protein